MIDSAEGYEHDLRGALPPIPPVGIGGLDIVRARDGELQVLEDNLRTPSGYTYASAAREALNHTLPKGVPEREPLRAPLAEQIARVLRDASPDGVDEPLVVVLSDGPGGSAWFEHSTVAGRLGVPVVTLDEVERHGECLYLRDEDSRLRQVHVLYRRSDEDRLRDEDGRLTAVAEAVLEPWTRGNLAVVNAFGTGVGDDKLVHAYVEEMIRFYLEEEPLLPSVPTLQLGHEEDREAVLSRPRRSTWSSRATVMVAVAWSSARTRTRPTCGGCAATSPPRRTSTSPSRRWPSRIIRRSCPAGGSSRATSTCARSSSPPRPGSRWCPAA